MISTARTFLVLLLAGLSILPFSARAQTIVTLGSGFVLPTGVALDSNGNLFVADFETYGAGTVYELPAEGNYTTVKTIATGFQYLTGIALDGNDNIFVVDHILYEIPSAGGYNKVNRIGPSTGFSEPTGVAVDGTGNIFIADGEGGLKEIEAATGTLNLIDYFYGGRVTGVAVDRSGNVFAANEAGIYEYLASDGFTRNQLGGYVSIPTALAVDDADNLFVADQGTNEVLELSAAGGYATTTRLGNGLDGPEGVAVDRNGNVFVGDSNNHLVKEVLNGPPKIVASVLPGARSVQIGTPATILASVINASATALDNCQILLPPTAPTGLTLDYQTTDPTTNALIGSLDMPVTIAGNGGLQTFLLSFKSSTPLTAYTMAVEFDCSQGNVTNVAAVVPGVNTVDITLSSTPIADIIALAATSTGNGIVELPNGGVGAFSVASENLGIADSITVFALPSSSALPVSATICQTNPHTAQCLTPPAGSITLDYAHGATPTFSVFLQSSGAIPFDPANSRINVEFWDGNGNLYGLTSVAIEAS